MGGGLWQEAVAVGTYLGITGTQNPLTGCQEHLGLTPYSPDNPFVRVLDL